MESNDLESALNSAKDSVDKIEEPKQEVPQMSKEEEIGFHKGAVNTLMAERAELVKMVGNVEGIASMHAKRLQELGAELK